MTQRRLRLRLRLLGAPLLALGMAGLGSAHPTFAASRQVANCTFAALQADLGAGGDWYYAPGQCPDPIVFTGTVGVQNMDGISSSVTAQGNDVTLEGSAASMFEVSSPWGAPIVSLSLTGFTVRNGSSAIDVQSGGAMTISHSTFSSFSNGVIDNLGYDLSIDHSSFSSNSGYAISNNSWASVNETITNSTFSNNGGAIWNSSPTLSISDSTFTSNSAAQGGAIENHRGNVTIDASTFSNNLASSGGGAIDQDGAYQAMTSISNSTFSGNSAPDGGAIFNNSPQSSGNVTSFFISNSTFTGNQATGGTGPQQLLGGDGGAIFNWDLLQMYNSTVYGNSAVQWAGGNQIDSDGIFEFAGNIIGGSPSGGTDCSNYPGSHTDIFATEGYNLNEDTQGSCFVHGKTSTDVIGKDPRLDPKGLQDNGGPTQTIALKIGSPLIDAIPTSVLSVDQSAPICDATDQRGHTRPDDTESACDIGAYEYSFPPHATNLTVSGAGSYGSSATLSGYLTDNGSPVSGEPVSFTLNGNGVCGSTTGIACPITDSSGVATLKNVSLTGVNAGSYPTAVGADFAGDGSYTGSSASGALTVAKADQTINVSSHAPASATYGSTFTVAATASSGLAVSYSSSGSCSNSGSAFTITSNTGTCTVAYNQAGTSNYNPASGVTETVNAEMGAQTITFDPLANHTYGDAPFTMSVTASSGLPVSFTVGSADQCTVKGNTVTITGAGSCTVTASQTGDSNYAPANTVSRTFTINKALATITFDPASLSVTYDGSPHYATATTNPKGLTYSVDYEDFDGNTANPVDAGGYYVYAEVTDPNYTGNTYNPAGAAILWIWKASQTITFGPLTDHTYGDAPFTMSATASSGLPISFTVGATDQCTISGATVTITGAGSCTVTASQAGTGNYDAASNVSQTFTINKGASTTNLTSSVNPSVSGQGVTFTATVSPTIATGTVQFQIDGSNSGSPVPLTGGHAILTSSDLAVGSHTISAVYSGNSNLIGSTASGLTQTVNKGATTTSLASSVTPSIINQGVTLTATVASVAPGTETPGGMVTFKDGTSTLGTATLNTSGIATLTTTTLAAGTHNIIASYSGNSNYQSSTSSVLNQQVRYTVNVLSISSLAIVLQLQDFTGTNVSASKVTVTAQCVVPYSQTPPTTCGATPLQSIAKAFGFTNNYKGMGPAYSYSVNPHGLTKGQQYDLLVQTDGDPIWHAIPFTA